ncbi:hypothetical protein EV356DRAFT_573747 [Viridothelium virens]|uniref:Uncharacterized protein n=1 Tax=Viridothelium virens TaxID=1048519 RepID=A0A6A6HJW2_VIRVR|nr:hypothetical protein EV356DRAFT_573747 [Viridothelium virens]
MPTPKESMPSDEPSQGTLDKAVGPLIQNQGKSSSPDRPSTSSPFLMNNKQHIRHSTTHVESQSVISHDATMNNVSSVSDPSAVLRNVEPTKGLVSPQNMSALPPPLPPKSPLRQSTLGSQSPEKRFSFPPPLPPKSPLRSQSVSPLPLESPYRSQAVPRLPPKSPLRSRPIPPTLVLMLPRKDQSSTTILYSPSIYSEISVRSRLPAKYPLHKDQSSTTILYSPSIYSEISVRPRLPTKYPSLDYCPTAVQACIRQHSTVRRLERSAEKSEYWDGWYSWPAQYEDTDSGSKDVHSIEPSTHSVSTYSTAQSDKESYTISVYTESTRQSAVPAPLKIGRSLRNDGSGTLRPRRRSAPSQPFQLRRRADLTTFRPHDSILSTEVFPPTPRGPCRDIRSQEIMTLSPLSPRRSDSTGSSTWESVP